MLRWLLPALLLALTASPAVRAQQRPEPPATPALAGAPAVPAAALPAATGASANPSDPAQQDFSTDPATRIRAERTPPRIEVRQNFYPDGTLRTQWQVRVGPHGEAVRHGRLLSYHPNGRLALRGVYRDGRPSGVWSWYDERGHLLRSAAPQGDYDEILTGRNLENPNTVYRDLHGRKVAEGLRKYDKPHGLWTYYHPDGSVSARGRFINGLPDGRWVMYFASGMVRRLDDYKLGVPDGEVMRGWPNGQERLEGRTEQGLRVGHWRTWYQDGQIESEGDYREDRRDGEWRFWDATGKLVRHLRYAAGRIVAELPLPTPRVGPPPVVPEPQLLPFRPRIYDESGTQIKLESK